MSTSTPWTAAAVHAALEQHVFPMDKFVYLREVRADRGFNNSATADAIAICYFKSRGHFVEGIEIKVSRSDWLSELRNVGKSDEIWQKCAAWHVAAPEGIVKKEELPDGWGLIEVSGDKPPRRTVKARYRDDVPAMSGFVMSLLVNMSRGSERHINDQVNARTNNIYSKHYSEIQIEKAKIRELENKLTFHTTNEKLIENLRLVMKEAGIYQYDLLNNPRQIIDRMKKINALEQYHRSKEVIFAELDDLVARAVEFKKQLTEAPPDAVRPEHQPGDGDSIRSDQPEQDRAGSV